MGNFIIKNMKLIIIPTILIAVTLVNVAQAAELDYFNFGHVMQFLYGLG